MRQIFRQSMAAVMAVALMVSPGFVFAAEQSGTAPAQNAAPDSAEAAQQLSAAELEQLAAPVALYPDDLLAQVLMASTYPLEVVAAARWVKANPKLSGADLDKALQQQPWDPSVRSLAKVPQTLQMMNEKLDWTEKLGNAFLAQPKDVMDATQRLRAKAEAQGALKSNKQQTVKVETAPGTTTKIIVVQPAQPEVVYVPSYNPTVVYGPWPYPAYPPYAWYPPGYAVAGAVISFGVGVAVGSAFWGHPNWYHGDVDINVNRYTNFNGHPPPPPPPPRGGGTASAGGHAWQHNPDHRGNVPYDNARVANHFQRPGQGGISPAQERIKAREAFRGHGDAGSRIGRPGGAGGGQERHPGALSGGGVRPGGGGAGERLDRGGSRPGADGAGVRRDGTSGEHRQQLGQGGHGIQNRSGDRASAFQGAGGQGAHRDSQRGSQSREIMRSHPGGGGVHGGGGFHGGGHGGFRR